MIVAAAVAISFATNAVLQWQGIMYPPQRIATVLTSPETETSRKLLISLDLVVFTPILEEAIFRFGLFGILLRDICRMRPRFAALAGAGIFAVLHFYPPGVPAFVFLGYALAMMYHETGSLRRPVACHAAFNLVNLLFCLV